MSIWQKCMVKIKQLVNATKQTVNTINSNDYMLRSNLQQTSMESYLLIFQMMHEWTRMTGFVVQGHNCSVCIDEERLYDCVCLQLNCFGRHRRQTAPQSAGSRDELFAPPLHSRINGWSLPLHSFQLLAWLVYSFMAIVGFGIYVPLLPAPWSFAAYAVSFTSNPQKQKRFMDSDHKTHCALVKHHVVICFHFFNSSK